MYSIGEFSKITALTVKTLRFYHEQGVLTPSCVDDESGYRYYAAGKIETARVIATLRQLDFTLAEIKAILEEYSDEGELLEYLVQHRESVREKMRKYREIGAFLDKVIANEREAREAMKDPQFTIVEKAVDPMLVAGVRMKGNYSECGKGFSQIGRRFGRHLCGKPLLLHYDSEYREDDANFEACMPIRKGEDRDGICVRELPGGRFITLLYQGPYEEIGPSYATIMEHIKRQELQYELPTREVYIKGPGMILRGNPKKYLTEIQFRIRE